MDSKRWAFRLHLEARGGLFYMKDPSGPASRHDDVPYARGQMEAWLVGAFENRYAIRAAGEARP